MGQARTQFVPYHPSAGQGNRCQSQGAVQAPTISQMGHMGQGMGRGRGQDFQAGTSGTKGNVYVVIPQTDLAD